MMKDPTDVFSFRLFTVGNRHHLEWIPPETVDGTPELLYSKRSGKETDRANGRARLYATFVSGEKLSTSGGPGTWR